VAQGAPASEIFASVSEEAARVLELPSSLIVRYVSDDEATVIAAFNAQFDVGTSWPLDGESITQLVLETGRAVRMDDYGRARSTIADLVHPVGVRSAIGAPVVVDGRTWGAIVATSRSAEPIPDGSETRLALFTELVATAVSNAQANEDLRGLADEQAALRRLATLVAEGADSATVFDAVCEETGRLVGAASVNLSHYTADGFNVTVAGWSLRDTHVPVGTRAAVARDTIAGEITRTHLPARIDDWDRATSELARLVRERGVRSSVGAPVVVEGTVWGALVAGTDQEEPLPAGTELRLARFTELIATAISNTEARESERRLADEHAALRRVATLVAEGATPPEVFAAVAEEVAHVLDVALSAVVRYEPEGVATEVGAWGRENPFPVGTSWKLDGTSVSALVAATGRPARVTDYADVPGPISTALARDAGIRTAVGAPILVGGDLWGVMMALSTEQRPLPEDTEGRLALFTELVGTAISNAEARDDQRRLAEEQASLRRVATLVAEGATPNELYSAVANEVAERLHVSAALLDRYDPDGTAVTLALTVDPLWESAQRILQVGRRWPPDPGSLNAAIRETGRAARIDDYSDLMGEVAEIARAAGFGSGCAAPILVDGAVWGEIRVYSERGVRLPDDTIRRLHGFTELVATALSNAAARAELIASRARIVAAGDEARRRIERDLHDGTQQRLIAFGLDLQRVRALLADDAAAAAEGLDQLEEDLLGVLEDVRELSSGLHPPLLTRRGFVPALRALARRTPIPLEIDIDLRDRPPAAIETALYYVASEALTNAVKHSQASVVTILVESDHVGAPFGIGLDGRRGAGNLYVTIADDGVGGADASSGSGLTGLSDRIDALGGRLTVESPTGQGTRISIVLPIEPPRPA
jgi:signal transduction histidine kinase